MSGYGGGYGGPKVEPRARITVETENGVGGSTIAFSRPYDPKATSGANSLLAVYDELAKQARSAVVDNRVK